MAEQTPLDWFIASFYNHTFFCNINIYLFIPYILLRIPAQLHWWGFIKIHNVHIQITCEFIFLLLKPGLHCPDCGARWSPMAKSAGFVSTVQITFIFIGQTHLVFGKRVCTCVMKHSNAFRTFLNWLKNSKRVWHERKLHIMRVPLFANFDRWSVSVGWV